MSQLREYPSHDNKDILYLGGVSELHRINRNERYIEVGPMVSIQRLLTVGQHILHPVLAHACKRLGPPIIRSQATIGGSLCHPNLRLNLATALMILETQVEIKDSRSTKSSTRWVPIHRLYKRDGSLGLIHGEIITRLRVFFEDANFQCFSIIGDPFYHPETAVIFAVFAKYEKSTISEFRFSLSLPSIDIFRSKEIEASITSKDLPLSAKEIIAISGQLRELLSNYSSKIQKVQIERSCRILEKTLQDMNTKVFAN